MKVSLITSTPEYLVGESGKICYATKTIEEGGKDITSSLVHKHKHLAVLRFAFAVVEIENISIACQNQIVRSKHLDFLVQSKRYVDPDRGGFDFIMPNNLEPEIQDWMTGHFEESLSLYGDLIMRGVKKEDARAVLPMNTSTKMRVAGNLQAWYDFFKLRLTSHAQEEIREVAKSIYDLLSDKYPQIFTQELFNELHK